MEKKSETKSHQPNPTEIAEARLRMTPEERERLAVREIFYESEHRLVEMPSDLHYRELFSYGRGSYIEISGTFDGRHLDLVYAPELTGLRGSADGERLSIEEVNELWEKIYPVAKQYYLYQEAERKALQNLQEERVKDKIRSEDLRPGEPRFRIKDQELAHELASKEKTKRSEIEGLLNKNLEGVELSVEDREFAKKIIGEIVELSVARTQDSFLEDEHTVASINDVLQFRAWDRDGTAASSEKSDQYNRKKAILYKLLGVDVNQGQVWQAGIINTYTHSRVYSTTIPDIIVREEYENEYQRVGTGSQIHIERNSRFAKT